MFDNVNLYKPDKIIRLSELSDSSEIYDIMKKMNARSYAYGIGYQPDDELRIIFVKIGRSSPDKNRTNDRIYGERVVRQVAWLDGWTTTKHSANGADYYKGMCDLVANGDFPERALHKNNTIIGIWNCNPLFRTCKSDATEYEQTEWLEAYLCKEYKNDFKLNLPPLNRRDPSTGSILKRPMVSTEIMDSLFKFE
jgi:hypothetical protein